MGRRLRKRKREPQANTPVGRPEDTAPEARSLSTAVETTKWAGPLPPPEVLRAFREAVPRSDEVGTVAGGIYLAALGHIWGAGIVIAGPLVSIAFRRSKPAEK